MNLAIKLKITFNGLNLSIIEPNSVSENIITHQESKELYFILKKFLNK